MAFGSALVAALISSCGCTGCGHDGEDYVSSDCENQHYVQKEVTEWIEETQEVVVSGKGGKQTITETITTRRPVVSTVNEYVPCGTCGSKFCAKPECCGIVSKAVLSRASAQGATGEPHLGTIPTMKVLVKGARSNTELCPQ